MVGATGAGDIVPGETCPHGYSKSCYRCDAPDIIGYIVLDCGDYKGRTQYNLTGITSTHDDRIMYQYAPPCSCGMDCVMLGAHSLVKVEIY
jgi:hypothetical protein